MKPAKYTLSDSESEAENFDNDDLLFSTEPMDILSSIDRDQKFDNLISAVKKKNPEKPKKPKASKITKVKEKKPKVEVVKQPKPAELIKSVSLVIDSSLLNHKFGSELLAALRTADIRYNVQDQISPSTITWILDNDQPSQQFFENYIIFLWTWKDFVDSIAGKTLYTDLKYKMKSSPNSKLTLLIFGMEEYFRKSKTWKTPDTNPESKEKNSNKTNKSEKTAILSRNDIEVAVAELQLLNLQYRFFETGQDLGLYIVQFTKALTELPFKLEKNKRLECADWYATGDSRECIRVDPAGNGLMNLWQQQICQFPNVTLDVAQAIVSNYSSPLALINIRRVHGPLTSVRKIGPELSKKVHQFFCGEDGNLFVS